MKSTVINITMFWGCPAIVHGRPITIYYDSTIISVGWLITTCTAWIICVTSVSTWLCRLLWCWLRGGKQTWWCHLYVCGIVGFENKPCAVCFIYNLCIDFIICHSVWVIHASYIGTIVRVALLNGFLCFNDFSTGVTCAWCLIDWVAVFTGSIQTFPLYKKSWNIWNKLIITYIYNIYKHKPPTNCWNPFHPL